MILFNYSMDIPMNTFDIFGGCVTRDLFSIPNAPGKLGKYFARTSLVSQVAPSLNVQPDEFEMASNFQKSMVLSDLNKHFINYLNEKKVADFIIFDFLVDRLNILKTNESYLTISNEFKSSNLNYEGITIDRSEHLKLLENAIIQIKPLLKAYKAVFLNKFYHAFEYKDTNENLLEFKNPNFIKKENDYLNKIYDFFTKHIENAIILENEVFISSSNHKWGLTTYHFEEKFYIDTNQKIKNKLNKF